MSRRGAVAWFVVTLLGPHLCVSGCRSAPAPEATPFDVLIVVLDACRADKFGCYGFDRETTPTIDRLAREADTVIFRRHHVQGSWTKPSTASLFSGLFVFQHGVVLGYQPEKITGPERRFRTDILGPQILTLAERMQQAGFATVGMANNDLLVASNGYTQGFSEWLSPAELNGGDPKYMRTFAAWLASHRERYFGYLHFNGCHYPYEAHRRDAQYLARYGFEYNEASRRAAGIDFAAPGFGVRDAIRKGTLQLEPDDVRFVHLLYEARLRWLDAMVVAPLLDALRSSGRYDDTLLILTADHGEELYDHHSYAHDHALWEELLHVPLIVKFPRGRRPSQLGSAVEAITNSVDLLPSLLSFVGHPVADQLPGVQIFQGDSAGFAFAEIGYTAEWALLQGNYKLIDGEHAPRLFDLAADPGERTDLAATQPGRVEAMRAMAKALTNQKGQAALHAPMVERTLPADVIERLRNLGYLE